MDVKKISDALSVSPQILPSDIAELNESGFRSIICNRPDGEEDGQPTFNEIQQAAEVAGLQVRYLPVVPGQVGDDDVAGFSAAMSELPQPTLAFCRTGTRSATLWSLSEAGSQPVSDILETTKAAGYDMSGIAERMSSNSDMSDQNAAGSTIDVVIVGGGAAGISVASSLLKRQPSLQVSIIEPEDVHYYQPGWTMVGGGIFQPKATAKKMASLMPSGVQWKKAKVDSFDPKTNSLHLNDGEVVSYKRLIVCPGLKLDWDKVEGLTETLGQNGVTSNYRYDLAPYTWSLVQSLKSGKAVFTQPPMPIKCAGAPQKALYLSGDHWFREGRINDIDISFNNAGGVLFGVKEYVPALQSYMDRYQASLNFFHNLVAVDGSAKKAWFDVSVPDEPVRRIETEFDMMHVCPPQSAPDIIQQSPLADGAGWVDVEQTTLRHKTFDNVWALGDVTNAPNAKTAAAARKQAPVVAANVVADINGKSAVAAYDGYGSCPLTVERGKIVLAEFGYGGKLLPSFPEWLVNGKQPTKAAWFLKAKMLPPIYWHAMLKGHEIMAKPEKYISTE